MDQYTFFQSLLFFLYLYYYNPHPILINVIRRMFYNLSYLIDKTVKNFLLSFDVLVEYDVDNQDNVLKDKKDQNKKYEDKYLEEIRKMNKEFDFTAEELELRELKRTSFYIISVSNYTNEIREIDNKLTILNKKQKIVNTIIEGDVSYKEQEEEAEQEAQEEEEEAEQEEEHDQNIPDLAPPFLKVELQ